ncbi:Os09g0128900 [Oryza sativa Japonica Group]|uniref:Os09g0128900 protein n=1 Tax=Oryza sativa subsp. japonica TaxID=39947 RepID=A0A0P0XJT6_ORYSJ|nr:Os09g0128900 [Oryza sativa Japonica Group]
MSHCGIGTGVTILRHNDYYDYVLVELFSHQDTRTHLASNKVTLFLWWSPSSGPRSVDTERDMVFAVLTTSLCWVDLRTGILVCDHIDKLSTGTDDDDDHLLLFFISLPEECVMKPSLLSWKRLAEEHRTMICRDPETILFISMDNYIQGLPIGDTVLTTWTLKFPLTNHWTWEKHSAPSLFVGDLLNDLPVLKLKNPRMIGRRCTLPTARSVALTVKTILSLASLLPSMRGSMSKGIGESRDSVRDQH